MSKRATKTQRQTRMAFGPEMPIVPVGDFSQWKLSKEDWNRAWQLCGPSAEKNMMGRMRRRMELWQVIAAAYLEGLYHGSGIEREGRENI